MLQKFFRKTTSLFLLTVFLLTQLDLKFLQASTLLPDLFFSRASFSLNLPSEWGKVDFVSSENPKVFIIQDPHGHYEGQENISHILEWLQKETGISKVLLEGGYGAQDIRELEWFEKPEVNLKAVKALMRSGEIGGAEVFLMRQYILNRNQIPVIGLEDKRLYLKNLSLFQQVARNRQHSEKYLDKGLSELRTKASRLKNPVLYEFLKNWLYYEADKIDLQSYLSILHQFAKKNLSLDLSLAASQWKWPMLVRYFTLKERAKNQILSSGEQKEKLLSWAKQKSIGFDFNEGQDRRRFWEDFYSKAKDQGFEFDLFPDFIQEEGSRILQEEVDGKRLIEEIETLRDETLLSLVNNSNENDLLQEVKMLLALKKFLMLEMTPGEFAKAKNLIAENDFHSHLPQGIKDLIHSGIDFYETAKKRDSIFVKAISQEVKNQRRTIVVISGGFHTPGIEKELKEQKISYGIISPRLSENEFKNAEKKYASVMLNEKPILDLQDFALRQIPLIQMELPPLWGVRKGILRRSLAHADRSAKLRSEIRSEDSELSDFLKIPGYESGTLPLIAKVLNEFREAATARDLKKLKELYTEFFTYFTSKKRKELDASIFKTALEYSELTNEGKPSGTLHQNPEKALDAIRFMDEKHRSDPDIRKLVAEALGALAVISANMAMLISSRSIKRDNAQEEFVRPDYNTMGERHLHEYFEAFRESVRNSMAITAYFDANLGFRFGYPSEDGNQLDEGQAFWINDIIVARHFGLIPTIRWQDLWLAFNRSEDEIESVELIRANGVNTGPGLLIKLKNQVGLETNGQRVLSLMLLNQEMPEILGESETLEETNNAVITSEEELSHYSFSTSDSDEIKNEKRDKLKKAILEHRYLIRTGWWQKYAYDETARTYSQVVGETPAQRWAIRSAMKAGVYTSNRHQYLPIVKTHRGFQTVVNFYSAIGMRDHFLRVVSEAKLDPSRLYMYPFDDEKKMERFWKLLEMDVLKPIFQLLADTTNERTAKENWTIPPTTFEHIRERVFKNLDLILENNEEIFKAVSQMSKEHQAGFALELAKIVFPTYIIDLDFIEERLRDLIQKKFSVSLLTYHHPYVKITSELNFYYARIGLFWQALKAPLDFDAEEKMQKGIVSQENGFFPIHLLNDTATYLEQSSQILERLTSPPVNDPEPDFMRALLQLRLEAQRIANGPEKDDMAISALVEKVQELIGNNSGHPQIQVIQQFLVRVKQLNSQSEETPTLVDVPLTVQEQFLRLENYSPDTLRLIAEFLDPAFVRELIHKKDDKYRARKHREFFSYFLKRDLPANEKLLFYRALQQLGVPYFLEDPNRLLLQTKLFEGNSRPFKDKDLPRNVYDPTSTLVRVAVNMASILAAQSANQSEEELRDERKVTVGSNPSFPELLKLTAESFRLFLRYRGDLPIRGIHAGYFPSPGTEDNFQHELPIDQEPPVYLPSLLAMQVLGLDSDLLGTEVLSATYGLNNNRLLSVEYVPPHDPRKPKSQSLADAAEIDPEKISPPSLVLHFKYPIKGLHGSYKTVSLVLLKNQMPVNPEDSYNKLADNVQFDQEKVRAFEFSAEGKDEDNQNRRTNLRFVLEEGLVLIRTGWFFPGMFDVRSRLAAGTIGRTNMEKGVWENRFRLNLSKSDNNQPWAMYAIDNYELAKAISDYYLGLGLKYRYTWVHQIDDQQHWKRMTKILPDESEEAQMKAIQEFTRISQHRVFRPVLKLLSSYRITSETVSSDYEVDQAVSDPDWLIAHKDVPTIARDILQKLSNIVESENFETKLQSLLDGVLSQTQANIAFALIRFILPANYSRNSLIIKELKNLIKKEFGVDQVEENVSFANMKDVQDREGQRNSLMNEFWAIWEKPFKPSKSDLLKEKQKVFKDRPRIFALSFSSLEEFLKSIQILLELTQKKDEDEAWELAIAIREKAEKLDSVNPRDKLAAVTEIKATLQQLRIKTKENSRAAKAIPAFENQLSKFVEIKVEPEIGPVSVGRDSKAQTNDQATRVLDWSDKIAYTNAPPQPASIVPAGDGANRVAAAAASSAPVIPAPTETLPALIEAEIPDAGRRVPGKGLGDPIDYAISLLNNALKAAATTKKIDEVIERAKGLIEGEKLGLKEGRYKAALSNLRAKRTKLAAKEEQSARAQQIEAEKKQKEEQERQKQWNQANKLLGGMVLIDEESELSTIQALIKESERVLIPEDLREDFDAELFRLKNLEENLLSMSDADYGYTRALEYYKQLGIERQYSDSQLPLDGSLDISEQQLIVRRAWELIGYANQADNFHGRNVEEFYIPFGALAARLALLNNDLSEAEGWLEWLRPLGGEIPIEEFFLLSFFSRGMDLLRDVLAEETPQEADLKLAGHRLDLGLAIAEHLISEEQKKDAQTLLTQKSEKVQALEQQALEAEYEQIRQNARDDAETAYQLAKGYWEEEVKNAEESQKTAWANFVFELLNYGQEAKNFKDYFSKNRVTETNYYLLLIETLTLASEPFLYEKTQKTRLELFDEYQKKALQAATLAYGVKAPKRRELEAELKKMEKGISNAAEAYQKVIFANRQQFEKLLQKINDIPSRIQKKDFSRIDDGFMEKLLEEINLIIKEFDELNLVDDEKAFYMAVDSAKFILWSKFIRNQEQELDKIISGRRQTEKILGRAESLGEMIEWAIGAILELKNIPDQLTQYKPDDVNARVQAKVRDFRPQTNQRSELRFQTANPVAEKMTNGIVGLNETNRHRVALELAELLKADVQIVLPVVFILENSAFYFEIFNKAVRIAGVQNVRARITIAGNSSELKEPNAPGSVFNFIDGVPENVSIPQGSQTSVSFAQAPPHDWQKVETVPSFMISEAEFNKLNAEEKLLFALRLTELQLLAASEAEANSSFEITAELLNELGIAYVRTTWGLIELESHSLTSDFFTQWMAKHLTSTSA